VNVKYVTTFTVIPIWCHTFIYDNITEITIRVTVNPVKHNNYLF